MFEQLFSWFKRTQKRWLYGLLSLSLVISFGLVTPQPSYGISWVELILRGVQTLQVCNMSQQQEISLGKRINQQIKSQVRISRNRPLTRYINQIGERLAANSERPDLPYTFQVVDDDQINAFATLGGFVFVNTGLIKAAANEAELASVIGHEIGHVEKRHGVSQLCSRATNSAILSAAGLDENTAANIGVELALNLPNSREDELEADQIGLDFLKESGYAPVGIVSFMETLMEQGGASPPSLLSSHPATSNRIQALRAQIDPRTANVGDGLNNRSYRRYVRSLL